MYGLIYKITNDINSYCYIGQTTSSLNHRWSMHKEMGKNLIQANKLYTAMHKFGIEHFNIEKIEEFENISPEDLDIREQYWIEYYDSFYNGYNSTKGGKLGYRNIKDILCYTLSGKLYKKYKTVGEAAHDLNINYNSIIVCLNNSLSESCGGFQWKYEDSKKEIIDLSTKEKFTGKKCYFIQYDLNGNYINHYLGVEEASKQTNCLASGIVRCAKKELQYSGNFIWRYGFQGEEIPQKITSIDFINTNRGKSRKIIKIDKNNHITSYKSLSEAARETGYSRHKITYNCDIYPRSTLQEEWFKYEEE